MENHAVSSKESIEVYHEDESMSIELYSSAQRAQSGEIEGHDMQVRLHQPEAEPVI